ncbi:hypothetical protein M231_01810 [Tremella mesenterica]|uniref:DUF1996 domain-containing protein n=1 Tax=Tremella mesenterica TaxID=5217 RepID=A0A4Q1BST0_TREME|nr:hypothetical protein M231_01810 [Tremella mesenterica]
MFVTILWSLIPTLVVAYDGRERYFSVGNPQFLRTRIDSIVSPNKVSGHEHNIVGVSNFNAGLTFEEAQKASCTTSYIQADKSAYWVPGLFYQWKNDSTFSNIQGDGIVTYWKYAQSGPNDTFAVVPDDFRMVAGNVSRDTLDIQEAKNNAVSFECIGDGWDYKFPYIPADLECPAIRTQIFFPSCWNGKDAYLSDNSHVSYPLNTDQYEGAPCPPTHPHRIPSLFMEAYYHPKDALGPDYEWYPGCLVLSTGDNFGLSFHADWQNGFPSGMLVDAFNQCQDQLNGTPVGCAVFDASIDHAAADGCYPTGQLVAEPVGLNKRLPNLPGNNPVYNSSALANKPKIPRPGYVETAVLVNVPADKSGTCQGIGNRVCTDYDGPVPESNQPNPNDNSGNSSTSAPSSSSSMPMDMPMPSGSSSSSAASNPVTSSSVGMGGTPEAIQTGGGDVLLAGGSSSSMPTPSGNPVGGCERRRKRSRGRAVQEEYDDYDW